jgi:hypothetical protein
MKKFQFSKYSIIGLFSIIISVGFTACIEDIGWNVDPAYNRLFSTLTFAATPTATTVTLKWQKMPNTDHYVIELHKDSLEFSHLVATFDNVTDDSLVIPDLIGNYRYSARIKGMSNTAGKGESRFIELTFKTKAEQIMLPVAAGDKTSNSVTVHWIPNSKVTHLLVTPAVDNPTPIKLDITADEAVAGAKQVTGLLANTTYKVDIYNTDENLRGSITFRTYEEVPSIGQVIYMQPGDSINLRLAEATSNAVTLVFPQGSYYQRDTSLPLKDGMSIVFYGLPGANPATISLNSVVLGANHGTLRFENLNITGKFNNADGTLAATQRDYFINQGLISNVSSLEFKNCQIHNFNRNLLRLKDAGDFKTIDNLSITGCTVFEQGSGSYPLIGNTIANGLINNITISSSTFYNMYHSVIQQSLVNSTSITISDCTFNNIVGAGRYFIDCSTFGPTGAFTLSNCIFGKSFDVAAKGIRSSKIPTVVNSYKTSDWVTAANAIPGLTDYSGASTALFKSSSAGDFTINDGTFAGRLDSGDPRWRLAQ